MIRLIKKLFKRSRKITESSSKQSDENLIKDVAVECTLSPTKYHCTHSVKKKRKETHGKFADINEIEVEYFVHVCCWCGEHRDSTTIYSKQLYAQQQLEGLYQQQLGSHLNQSTELQNIGGLIGRLNGRQGNDRGPLGH